MWAILKEPWRILPDEKPMNEILQLNQNLDQFCQYHRPRFVEPIRMVVVSLDYFMDKKYSPPDWMEAEGPSEHPSKAKDGADPGHGEP